MSDTDPKLETAAAKLAEATPPHLGKPTTPILSWRLNGDNLVVILADGRKVRGLLADYLPIPKPPSKPSWLPTPTKTESASKSPPVKDIEDLLVASIEKVFGAPPVHASADKPQAVRPPHLTKKAPPSAPRKRVL